MPHEPDRIVADTNCLVSRLLLPLLISDATLDDLADVLSRPKFDRYVSLEDRQEFIRVLSRVAERVPITSRIKACRDRKDDKFLEVAVSADADIIVTGDDDLLELHPFRGIEIITSREYLKR